MQAVFYFASSAFCIVFMQLVSFLKRLSSILSLYNNAFTLLGIHDKNVKI